MNTLLFAISAVGVLAISLTVWVCLDIRRRFLDSPDRRFD